SKKNTIIESVQEYYGEVLKTKDDLKTSACCPIDAMPVHLRPYMANVHEEVQEKFYGCGSPIPYALEGRTVLDLGCGTGRDVYTASQLVGEKGHVIGVDMTENQLAVATKYIDYHTDKFGYKKPNVTFHKGYIEDLKTIGLEDNSVDVVISNCVINLSPNKEQVFREIFRVLKTGGELYFSDVFTNKRVPENLTNDPILLGECLGGAMYIEDFRRILRKIGCLDYRIVTKSLIALNDKEVQRKAGMIDFYSMTIRAFKCDFEDVCEDYGHVAYYNGTIADSPHAFMLDDHHIFKKDQPSLICGNTAKMLSETHYGQHFRIVGDFSQHLGIFDCAPSNLSTVTSSIEAACC
ncbi:MAG: methyltransferase domain-containing protein, partial [Rickettsiales bacterium]